MKGRSLAVLKAGPPECDRSSVNTAIRVDFVSSICHEQLTEFQKVYRWPLASSYGLVLSQLCATNSQSVQFDGGMVNRSFEHRMRNNIHRKMRHNIKG